eukprot:1057610-Prorocentrum_minimum.AAC.1
MNGETVIGSIADCGGACGWRYSDERGRRCNESPTGNVPQVNTDAQGWDEACVCLRWEASRHEEPRVGQAVLYPPTPTLTVSSCLTSSVNAWQMENKPPSHHMLHARLTHHTHM